MAGCAIMTREKYSMQKIFGLLNFMLDFWCFPDCRVPKYRNYV